MNELLGLVALTVFTLMLTIGVNHSLHDLISQWRRPGALLRAMLSALVAFPLVVFLLLAIFDVSPAAASAMSLLAAAPGAPLTTKRSQMVGADAEYITSLQLTLAVFAVVVTPLILGSFHAAFDLLAEGVTPLEVAAQIGQVTLLPVLLGLLLRRFAPRLVGRISRLLTIVSNGLFIVMVLTITVALIVAQGLRASLLVGWPELLVISVPAIAAVAIGHVLGGPLPGQRSGLAIACLARNVGLALYIAALGGIEQAVASAILAYVILGLTVQIAYALWLRLRKRSA